MNGRSKTPISRKHANLKEVRLKATGSEARVGTTADVEVLRTATLAEGEPKDKTVITPIRGAREGGFGTPMNFIDGPARIYSNVVSVGAKHGV